MIAFPRTRVQIGLEPAEADRLALEFAKMEEGPPRAGLGAFDVFDVGAAVQRRREWLEASVPAHEVEVDPFEIEVDPVTNAQWARYMTKTGAGKPARWAPGAEDRFVTSISWHEAQMYARHHGLDLPREAEWECAARRDRSFFTWGDVYFPQGEIAFRPPVDEPYPVGTRPEIATVHGVHDLLGQFGEYCADPFEPYGGANLEIWNRLFPNRSGQREIGEIRTGDNFLATGKGCGRETVACPSLAL